MESMESRFKKRTKLAVKKNLKTNVFKNILCVSTDFIIISSHLLAIQCILQSEILKFLEKKKLLSISGPRVY